MNILPRTTGKQSGLGMIESLEPRRLMSVAFGSNIILNPGAENYSGRADGFNTITPLHWTANGDPTVAQYGSGYGAEIGIRKPDDGGNAFFTGGSDSENTDFFQSIDLSSIASQIDAGQVKFTLSAELGGYSIADDNAQVFVNFENASSAQIASVGTGSVSASDRDYTTKLIALYHVGTIPALARFAQVQIHFKRDQPDGYNNGFADNASLVLYTDTPSTVGITPSFIKSTLPGDAISGLKTTGTLVLGLTNTSSSINRGLDTISLLASTDDAIDSNSILLGSVKRRLAFGAGRSTRLAFPVKILGVPAGIYSIFAQTTDSYGTVDTAVGPAIVVAPQIISFSATVSATRPATVKAGRAISFTLSLENSGNVTATGLATFAVGLSSDGATLTNPIVTLLRRVTVRDGNRAVRLRFTVKVPAGLAGVFDPFLTFTLGSNSVTTIGSSPLTVAN